ncbi:hypothetical protein GN244_ATG05983 [Phytophthora infestans]|uniref:Uncharacterized protein n=1 Tax=Phytophthora infestans TaxID=4787 RepID=A0A833T1B2_PHYIN|nr:hypothetical protein GN244_ATG05983 [Phytophthora infestans]
MNVSVRIIKRVTNWAQAIPQRYRHADRASVSNSQRDKFARGGYTVIRDTTELSSRSLWTGH